MRPELWQVVTCRGAMVVLTGDTGTGKSSVLRASVEEYPTRVVAPPVEVCLYESGALQSAILDALAAALAMAQPGQKRWSQLAKRLRHASREAAVEVGKGLAEAAVEEVLELAKAKLGENVGKGLLRFLKTFASNDGKDLRRTLRAQSDASILRLLVRLADEVAAVAGRDIVISLDEGNRLSDEDQRVLASLATETAKRVRIVVAWSTAEVESWPGLARLRGLAGVDEVEIGGLSRDDVDGWLTGRRLGEHTDEVYVLTAGYPLLVEGLVAHLVGGGNLEGYSAPTLFNDVLRDALSRLPSDAHRMARRLSAFTHPLPERDIPGFLGVDAVAWGVLREALERERVFSVRYPDGAWFHEARRKFLWTNVLSAAERNQVGQAAYTELLARHGHDDCAGGVGRFRQIAELALYAADSRAQNSALSAVLELDDPELAILAAAIELETEGAGSHTPADQVVIHAHTAFAAARVDALAALPALSDRGVVTLVELPRQSDDRTDTVVEVALDRESLVVARGRIHSVLGKAAVPQLATHVVRAHLERVRLESYAVITQAGHADALEVIIGANWLRGPAFVRPVGDPLLVMWLRFGEQPVTIAAVFNTPAERGIAERAVANLSASSFGRRLVVDRTLCDPSQTIPSLRFFRAVWFATGLSVHADSDGNFWLDLAEALPMAEFAQRQVDLLDVLRTQTSPVEREAYGLAQPVGVAIARRDTTEFRLDVRGSAHVYEMDFDDVEHILAEKEPLVSARLELALELPSRVTTQHLTTQTWTGQRVQDPIVEMFSRLHAMAVRFNERQPPTRVRLDIGRLRAQLAVAHARDQQLAKQISEKITIGGRRGHRPTRSLRLAIHTHGPAARPEQRFALSALPVGDPEDVQVRYVSGEELDTPEKIYQAAFGSDEEMTDSHGGMLPEVLGWLLGHAQSELEFS